jgi:large subunit ribosomal protein L6
MSRVGKMPIALPSGAEVTITAAQITVKGPLGSLSQSLNGLVKVENNAGTIKFEAANDSREANAMSGTLRALVNNMVSGVTKGFAPGCASDAERRQMRDPDADRDTDQGN